MSSLSLLQIKKNATVAKVLVLASMAALTAGFGMEPRRGVALVTKMRAPSTSTTALNLNPRIAKMIDGEYWRESHLKEWEHERHQHDEAVLEHNLPAKFDAAEDAFFEPTFHIQEKKDRKMAREHPQKYCADRCLSTGYCDAFEDFFALSPEEAVGFCTDCVLSEDEEPCEIPYEAMDALLLGEQEQHGPKKQQSDGGPLRP